MTMDPAPSEPAEPTRSFWSRWIGIYFSPGDTYQEIVRAPNFIPPLIVTIVSGLVFTETMLYRIGMEQIIRNAIEQSGRTGQMTPEQLEQAVQQGATFGTIFAHVAVILFPPIVLAIIAALGLAFVNGFFGGKTDFKRAFSVACYTNLVNVVGVVMALFIMIFGDAERFNPNNPMPTNPGFFLNPLETSKPLLAAVSSLDLFSFWYIVLLGIGYAAASGGKAKALTLGALFGGCWLVYVLIKVGFALIS